MAAADVAPPLFGVRVLVTRPAMQAQRLAERIERAGGEAVRFPTLDIVAVRDHAALARVLADIGRYDLAIFISPNAVAHGLEQLKTQGGLPPHLTLAAIGRGTADALARAGATPALVPAGDATSEALLALPALRDVAGKRIVVFRGEGGRELLGDTLRARGAEVTFAECYRRVRPNTDPAPLNARFQQGGIDVVTVTSVETLHHLHDMLDSAARRRLLQTPIVVVGPRQAEAWRTLGGATDAQIAAGADDGAILAALQAWRASQNSL
jgi:uroporphyrinogen-III synthase